MLGHAEFVQEILTRNPQMAREVDFRGSSPLHLAAASGHTMVVKSLLLANPEMSLSRDWEGRTPIHLAVIKGHIEVLKELVQVKPKAARANAGSRNILHLCIRHHRYEALECLVEVIGHNHEFMNSKDDNGCTILHLAAAYQQVQVVKLLLLKSLVELNAINHHGFTALDTALARGCENGKDVRIQELLKQYGALQAAQIASSHRTGSVMASESSEWPMVENKSSLEKRKKIKKKGTSWLEQKRSVLMVVASLNATMTYQAIINPPTNVWSRKPDGMKTEFDLKTLYDLRANFVIANCVSFYASLTIILLLISGIPLRWRFLMCLLMVIIWVAVISTMAAYGYALCILTLENDSTAKYTRMNYPVTFLIFILIGHTVRLVVKMAGRDRRRIMRQRGNSSPSQELFLV